MKSLSLIILVYATSVFLGKAQFDDRFYFPSKEWDKIENLSYDEFFFKIESDSLNAIVLQPSEFPKASFLFFHGSGGNISKYMFMTQALVEAGYQVLMIDFRGYGKSTGIPTHRNIAQDAQIVFNEIIKKNVLLSSKIFVYGASMGTQIAVKLAKENQTIIKGIVLDGTISSFTDMALMNTPIEQQEMVKQYVTSPYSAKNDIKDLKSMPKLFIHSKEDEAVPFTQGELVYNNANEPKELWVYTGKHLKAVEENRDLFLQKIKNLINQ